MDTKTFVIPVRDNIKLRFIRPDEAETLYLFVDKNRAHLREWLDWVDAQTGPDVLEGNIRQRIEKAKRGEEIDLGIYIEDQLSGSMGLKIVQKSRRAEIGYWLSKEYEGKGIMTDCVRALASYGFDVLKLHRIEIHCSVNNKKSSAIPKKLGFKLDGVFRDGSFLYDHFEDSEVYSMLEHEWRP